MENIMNNKKSFYTKNLYIQSGVQQIRHVKFEHKTGSLTFVRRKKGRLYAQSNPYQNDSC